MSNSSISTIEIPPFSNDLNTFRKGYYVLHGADEGQIDSHAECYEGFALKSARHGNEQIEMDVLDLFFVGVSKQERNRGIGYLLVQKSLEEAKKRGLYKIRLDIANPFVLRIMNRLRSEGIIDTERYVHTEYEAGVHASTDYVLGVEPHFSSSADALALFDNLRIDEDGMLKGIDQGQIEGIVQLKH